MTSRNYSYDSARNEWVFADGRRLAVVAGGDPTATPNQGEPVITVPAEEPPAPPAEPVVQQTQNPPPPTHQHTFTVEDIEKARREEKEKLYPRLEKMSEQLEVFAKEREEQQRLAAEQAAREEEERKRREEEEMDVRTLLQTKEEEWENSLKNVQSEWEQRYQALEEERNAQAALLEMERKFQELEAYKSRRIQEEQDNLMPELLDLITGDSEEAIDASISTVAAKSSAIVGTIQQHMPQQRVVRPVPATGSAPNGPLENSTEQQTYTMDDIKSMDMATFAQNRERLLAAVSRR